jgi:hypothetical protein
MRVRKLSPSRPRKQRSERAEKLRAAAERKEAVANERIAKGKAKLTAELDTMHWRFLLRVVSNMENAVGRGSEYLASVLRSEDTKGLLSPTNMQRKCNVLREYLRPHTTATEE